MSGGTGHSPVPLGTVQEEEEEEDQAWEQVISSRRTPASCLDLFLPPAPPGNQPCPEILHVGAAAMREGTVWTPSRIHSTANQPSSFVTHSRAATVEIQDNFLFAYERTLDVTWGEDLHETWM